MSRYSLQCIDAPHKGDSGGMSLFISFDQKTKEPIYEHDTQPKVGGVIRVGSLYARTMQYQDWWQTSLIEEILEEQENYIKFRTQNSIYEWRKF